VLRRNVTKYNVAKLEACAIGEQIAANHGRVFGFMTPIYDLHATTVGMGQNLLLANRSAMDHILDAIREIKAHSTGLMKKG
jgi:hypothetical protein